MNKKAKESLRRGIEQFKAGKVVPIRSKYKWNANDAFKEWMNESFDGTVAFSAAYKAAFQAGWKAREELN